MTMKDLQDREPETPELAQKLVKDWENIVLLHTPGGDMIFESETDIYKFMKANPNFFPDDVAVLPMKRGRMYYKDGKPYGDFGDFTLHF